jgi:hypothetical protein
MLFAVVAIVAPQVVVLAQHVVGVLPLEPERDAVLVVDADTVTVGTRQRFEPVTRRYRDIRRLSGRVDHEQLAAHRPPQRLWDPTRALRVAPVEDVRRRDVCERPNHLYEYTISV